MAKVNYRLLLNGDSAVTVEFGDIISPEINSLVMSLDNIIKSNVISGIIETIPTFRSLTICYNPLEISYSDIYKKLSKIIKKIKVSKTDKKKIIKIPVCYSLKYGEDMNDVCEHTKLSVDEIIKLHTSEDYLIYMLGFLPGFAYLGGLDKRLHCPRLDNPRTIIPQGSVGIGGEQTGIYPLASPGGWRLIGRTPIKPYDPLREKPFLYQAGDYIRFFAITDEEFELISNQNNYQCEIVEE